MLLDCKTAERPSSSASVCSAFVQTTDFARSGTINIDKQRDSVLRYFKSSKKLIFSRRSNAADVRNSVRLAINAYLAACFFALCLCRLGLAAPIELSEDDSKPLSVYILYDNDERQAWRHHPESLADVADTSRSVIDDNVIDNSMETEIYSKETEQLNYAVVSLLSRLASKRDDELILNMTKKSTLHRRSFEHPESRRSVHPCRWKLCGAYRRFH